MEREQVKRILLDHVEENYLSHLPEGIEFSAETHLFEQGIVDSIGVLMLVQFIEDRFDLKVEPDEMVIENFASIACMSRYVETKTT